MVPAAPPLPERAGLVTALLLEAGLPPGLEQVRAVWGGDVRDDHAAEHGQPDPFGLPGQGRGDAGTRGRG